MTLGAKMIKIESIMYQGKGYTISEEVEIEGPAILGGFVASLLKSECPRCSGKQGYVWFCDITRKMIWFCSQSKCLQIDGQINKLNARIELKQKNECRCEKESQELHQWLYNADEQYEKYLKRGENTVYHQDRRKK